MEMDIEENITCTSPELQEFTPSTLSSVLPAHSERQYNKAYDTFKSWQEQSHMEDISESVLLAYFTSLSLKMKPSSLWAIYSMLRRTIYLNDKVDICSYTILRAYLKTQNVGYKPQVYRVLSANHIKEFLASAPDFIYLFTKVGVIFGIMGDCRREEFLKIENNHVTDVNTALIVNIPNTRTNTGRQFVVGDDYYQICKKYMALRPAKATCTRFFLNYQKGKCTQQPVGINKFGHLPRVVAEFLKLPEPQLYTGNSLRKTSETLLADSGADITGLKKRMRKNRKPITIPQSLNNKVQTENTSIGNIDSSTNEEATYNDETMYNDDATFNDETPYNDEATYSDEATCSDNANFNKNEVTEVTTSATTININEHLVQNNVENYSTHSGPISISFTNCNNLSNLTFNIYIHK